MTKNVITRCDFSARYAQQKRGSVFAPKNTEIAYSVSVPVTALKGVEGTRGRKVEFNPFVKIRLWARLTHDLVFELYFECVNLTSILMILFSCSISVFCAMP